MCLMCASKLLSSDGRVIEFEDEGAATLGVGATAFVLRGRVPRHGSSATDDAAVKIVLLEGLTEEEIQRAARDMRTEVRRMRRAAGTSPFLKLYAADADLERPAYYTSPDGSTKKSLFKAEPPLLGDVYVELNRLFGWMGCEQTRYGLGYVLTRFEAGCMRDRNQAMRGLLADLKVVSKALIMTTQAHRGAVANHGIYCLDGFVNNIMLPRSVLHSPDGTLQRHSNDNGALFIDYANSIAAPETPSPTAHPPAPEFLGPRPARVPLDEDLQNQDARPVGTCWFRSPEQWAMLLGCGSTSAGQEEAAADDSQDEVAADERQEDGPSDVQDDEADESEGESEESDDDDSSDEDDDSEDDDSEDGEEEEDEMPPDTSRQIFEGWCRLRREMRDDGLLTGEGREEAVLVGLPSVAYGLGLLVFSTIGGRVAYHTAMLEAPEGMDPQEREQQMMLQWDEVREYFMSPDGYPLHGGQLSWPLEQICHEADLWWVKRWADIHAGVAEAVLRERQGERATVEHIHEQLFAALELLESPAVRQAVRLDEQPVPGPSAAARGVCEEVPVEERAAREDSGDETAASGDSGASPASRDAIPDSPLPEAAHMAAALPPPAAAAEDSDREVPETPAPAPAPSTSHSRAMWTMQRRSQCLSGLKRQLAQLPATCRLQRPPSRRLPS
ncbi:unnamed protein product [Vitrella brassicaformis CCMP3155]|uniref:Protein kinase domain-containing protein n=1 Tax=Vitrella brassicaformis (strain CCMP3155) TaxID=1169540 RepID=A0A0G4H177_VITBC|nr:unnamed protein product [Vitrella brassicaformis CCMP3155]|eukprot:CEM37315.1 unnamed protein product [Vitrella brassicaformis CCMP3155]